MIQLNDLISNDPLYKERLTINKVNELITHYNKSTDDVIDQMTSLDEVNYYLDDLEYLNNLNSEFKEVLNKILNKVIITIEGYRKEVVGNGRITGI